MAQLGSCKALPRLLFRLSRELQMPLAHRCGPWALGCVTDAEQPAACGLTGAHAENAPEQHVSKAQPRLPRAKGARCRERALEVSAVCVLS